MRTPTRTDVASALRHWEIAYSLAGIKGHQEELAADDKADRPRAQSRPRPINKGYADKSLVNVLEYLATRFHLQVRGSEATFRCPFHADHTPSLSFNLAQRVFYCHGCGERGDLLSFHMKVSGLPFKDACKDLGCWVEMGQ